MADSATAEDLTKIKTGLNKVDFVRNQNYLTRLATLIQEQEKENAQLISQLNSLRDSLAKHSL